MQVEPVQAVGYIPEWISLGPLVDVNGIPARAVLGDWEHLPVWHRPPKYISLSLTDPKPEPIPLAHGYVHQKYPGKSIGLLRGKRSGKVAVLFNGSSLGRHDLRRIAVPTIGMNRTFRGYPGYEGPDPDYLCVVDRVWLKTKEVASHPRLINGTIDKKNLGYRVTRSLRARPFSFDLLKDGYVCPIPATTGHLALQLAVYLGFTEIHCLGFDLCGNHFNGTPASRAFSMARDYHQKQAEVLKEHGINVYVCGSNKSRVRGFKRSSFTAVCS